MKLCGLSSYPAQKAMEFARRLPETACARAVELCLEADAQMKTSYDDPARILELLVIRLTGGRQ
jgi:DNA polymerase III delta subunit